MTTVPTSAGRGAATARASSREPSAWTVILAGVLGLAFLGLFGRWFWSQHLFSKDNMQDWGHAYVIPLISLAMVWHRRKELSRVAVASFWPAIPPLLLGVMAYVFFVVGVPNHMLQGAAMIGALGALLLLLLGVGAMRYLALPTAYLAFASTISEQVMIKVTFPLQLVAAKGAWLMLALVSKVAGYYVEVEGNTLTMITGAGEKIPLNVAEACSGMRMVVAFVALAAAVAFFQCSRWWERIAVLLIAAPVAIVLNMVRVAVLAWLSLWDPRLAGGDAHMLIGTLLLVPGLFMYLGAVWALGRLIVDPNAKGAKAVKA